jgi:RNA polymerase sigma factor (sigma-70 family)
MSTHEEIFIGLEGGNKKIIDNLNVTVFPVVKRWVLRNHGTEEDSKDVFHDALLIIIDKIHDENFCLDCEFSTYLIAVCKHRWFHELRKKSRMVLSDKIVDNLIDIPYDPIEDKKYQIYLSLIAKLDTRSKELIKLILAKKTLKEIAAIMKFKNPQAVADKKKNCIKKLINELIENKDYKELIDELSDLHREYHF